MRDFLAAGVPARSSCWAFRSTAAPGRCRAITGRSTCPARPRRDSASGRYSALRELPGQPGWLRLWDDAAQAPWLWNPEKKLFVSYEDPRSLRLKCALVRERGLGGVMFWEYSEDGGGELLRTLYEELLAPR